MMITSSTRCRWLVKTSKFFIFVLGNLYARILYARLCEFIETPIKVYLIMMQENRKIVQSIESVFIPLGNAFEIETFTVFDRNVNIECV